MAYTPASTAFAISATPPAGVCGLDYTAERASARRRKFWMTRIDEDRKSVLWPAVTENRRWMPWRANHRRLQQFFNFCRDGGGGTCTLGASGGNPYPALCLPLTRAAPRRRPRRCKTRDRLSPAPALNGDGCRCDGRITRRRRSVRILQMPIFGKRLTHVFTIQCPRISSPKTAPQSQPIRPRRRLSNVSSGTFWIRRQSPAKCRIRSKQKKTQKTDINSRPRFGSGVSALEQSLSGLGWGAGHVDWRGYLRLLRRRG